MNVTYHVTLNNIYMQHYYTADNFPNSYGGNDNCILLDWKYSYSNGWENHNCGSEFTFVCEVVAGIEPPTTVAPPTIPPIENCKEGIDDGWIKGPNDNCYKFFKTSSQADTWSSVEYSCLQQVNFHACRQSHLIKEIILL